MPELPISDGNGALKRLAPNIVAVHMLWPNDPGKREAALSSVAFRQLADSAGNPPTTAQAIELLHQAPSDAALKDLLAAAHDRLDSGRAVAATLVHVLKHAIEGGSRTDAYLALEVDIGYSKERTLRRRWKEFEPVAHLWVVAHWIGELRRDGTLPDDPFISEFAIELALAEDLRACGEAYIAPHAAGPLLNPATTWRVPADLLPRLPTIGYDPELVFGPPAR